MLFLELEPEVDRNVLKTDVHKVSLEVLGKDTVLVLKLFRELVVTGSLGLEGDAGELCHE